MEDFIATIDILAWPLVVIIAISLFKNQIRRLLDRIRRLGIGEAVMEFFEADSDYGEPPELLEPEAPAEIDVEGFKLDKPVTLFWLANDLMWIQDMLFRNAPKGAILESLRNIQKYSENLGLEGSMVHNEISRLTQSLEPKPGVPKVPWPAGYDLALAKQIETIKWSIASRLEEHEPRFEKLRVFPSRYY